MVEIHGPKRGIEVSSDVDALVAGARVALDLWRGLPALERGSLVTRAEGLLHARRKPFGLPPDGPDRARTFEARGSRIFAAERDELPPRLAGVVAVLGAADDPTGLAFWHLLPLLADGNTVLFAPHPKQWSVAEDLGRMLCEARLPSGVLSLVYDRDGSARELLLRHRGVSLVVVLGTFPPRVLEPAAREQIPPNEEGDGQ